jgi:hypothetical protein
MDYALKERIREFIHLLNNGSDNTEYLRGQVELAMNLLGYENDGEELRAELEAFAGNPDCTCDELDGDIDPDDGYTCYSCYEGKYDKVSQ